MQNGRDIVFKLGEKNGKVRWKIRDNLLVKELAMQREDGSIFLFCIFYTVLLKMLYIKNDFYSRSKEIGRGDITFIGNKR
ncbi:hypothetical protein CD32_08350 [Lysinibacillus odysseyi 34hs-1 = NBRC 100172]|uniref:Uncharacterized protein n=1 Tax=Lysinibacillus odysseyi 34hs-1 = NBRC 100172 TaxID=1220589 RepID=A0A0A3ISK9_9BACI|nr:hypothetical protein CD32_08350 [Lysinibacillus odysseyi 34hs-1 = NBRC 100172]